MQYSVFTRVFLKTTHYLRIGLVKSGLMLPYFKKTSPDLPKRRRNTAISVLVKTKPEKLALLINLLDSLMNATGKGKGFMLNNTLS